ncbi:hypothetical protein WJX77_011089 [Trebouxia sp. C0004]
MPKIPKGRAYAVERFPELTGVLLNAQAGTGAWIFQSWWKSLPAFVEVMPIELPGRGLRMKEARHTCVRSLVHSMLLALSPLLQDLPYAVFGHSLGAWIAFEMAQEARRLELPEPALLIVSANRAPHLAASHHDVDPTILHTLTYTDFWTAFEHRYGTIPDLMDHTVKQMVWPMLQADFKLLETHQDTTSSTLTCPLIAVGALQDNRYTADQVAAWGVHCRDFKEHWVTGKHDYIIKSAETSGLIRIISNALSADVQFPAVGHV